ncbi:hypothetical protein DIPPA_22911 [Diplonema papillatum]|nr:hypothetical protein DIPPA_22911 [Diplonema papillatum]
MQYYQALADLKFPMSEGDLQEFFRVVDKSGLDQSEVEESLQALEAHNARLSEAECQTACYECTTCAAQLSSAMLKTLPLRELEFEEEAKKLYDAVSYTYFGKTGFCNSAQRGSYLAKIEAVTQAEVAELRRVNKKLVAYHLQSARASCITVYRKHLVRHLLTICSEEGVRELLLQFHGYALMQAFTKLAKLWQGIFDLSIEDVSDAVRFTDKEAAAVEHLSRLVPEIARDEWANVVAKCSSLKDACMELLGEGGLESLLKGLSTIDVDAHISSTESAFKVYEASMESLSYPMAQDRFLAAHNEATTDALRCMKTASASDVAELKNRMRESFTTYFQLNDIDSQDGFLLKRGKHVASWKLRHCILRSAELQYFTVSPRGVNKYKGSIKMSDVERLDLYLQEHNSRALSNILQDVPALQINGDMRKSMSAEDLCSSKCSSIGYDDKGSIASSNVSRFALPWSFALDVVTAKRTFQLCFESELIRNQWHLAITNAARLNVVCLTDLL